jgi:DNA-binding transcriptional ArsR family regulator
MKEGPDIAPIAALIGDPGRANMLIALMAGKALTASELASEAGVTPQTASSHLAKLERAGLVRQRKQGRHRYFALATADVATVIEGLMGLSENRGTRRTRTGPRDAAMRKARVCYNHLAGEMGTRLFDHLIDHAFLSDQEGDLTLTNAGEVFFGRFGVDVAALSKGRAPLCRACLDWSERRSHLAGSLGRAVLTRIEMLGWARQDPNSRAILFSRKGENEFEALLVRM